MRRKDREITEMDDGYPYIVPLNYGFETDEGGLVFYMHCAKEGHKLDLIRRSPKVCIELECGAKLVPGGNIPCRYGLAFASVIGWGTVGIVEDEAEKIKGLELLMKNQTGRDFAFDGRMVSSVAVLKAVIPRFTAKSRRSPS